MTYLREPEAVCDALAQAVDEVEDAVLEQEVALDDAHQQLHKPRRDVAAGEEHQGQQEPLHRNERIGIILGRLAALYFGTRNLGFLGITLCRT